MRLTISGAQSLDHTTRHTSTKVVTVTIGRIAAIYVAWVGAWMLKGALDRHVAWVASPGGAIPGRRNLCCSMGLGVVW